MKSLCLLCDTSYDDSNPDEERIHEHPEPQSGHYRDRWLASKLPYENWITETPDGQRWFIERRKGK